MSCYDNIQTRDEKSQRKTIVEIPAEIFDILSRIASALEDIAAAEISIANAYCNRLVEESGSFIQPTGEGENGKTSKIQNP